MKHSVAQIGAIVTASSLLWVTPNEDLDNTIFNEVKSPLHSAAQRKQISISELNSKPEELPRFGGSAETLRREARTKMGGKRTSPTTFYLHSFNYCLKHTKGLTGNATVNHSTVRVRAVNYCRPQVVLINNTANMTNEKSCLDCITALVQPCAFRASFLGCWFWNGFQPKHFKPQRQGVK